ncbi:hypothetical protein CDL12_28263 [Handroanthus impetiginosus]|uniref:Uncharacterized protein n=1 Tax=Handroanthus impetiginosus TaxID=429701 RepID=A0A2G9G1P6_9LAMI|nr:hypothetical protein CDL12_28263 [Handroanthus impetiginosus]
MHFDDPKKLLSFCIMGISSDFKFWEEKLPVNGHSRGDEGDWVLQNIEDQVGAYSPQLWKRAPSETCPLLPQKHHYSYPSPTSRLGAIVDGRREMMEMIKDMPESFYELSLKDYIVDDKQNMDEVHEKVVTEEKKVKRKTESKTPPKSKNTKGNQICRTESMESEVFLLKMFLPVSLISKKKRKGKDRSKDCKGQSSEGSEKRAGKEWWKTMFLAAKDNQNSRKISRSTSDITSNTTSLIEKISVPCQSSIGKKKCKSQRGCLF